MWFNAEANKATNFALLQSRGKLTKTFYTGYLDISHCMDPNVHQAYCPTVCQHQ